MAALVGAIVETSGRVIAVLADGGSVLNEAVLVAAWTKLSVCSAFFLHGEISKKSQMVAAKQTQNVSRECNFPVPASAVFSIGLRMEEGT